MKMQGKPGLREKCICMSYSTHRQGTKVLNKGGLQCQM